MSAIRTRSIRPGFWLNGVLCSLSRDARLLFIALWCFADREGRLDGRPMQIRRHLFPFDVDLTEQKIATLIGDLERAGFVSQYEVGGDKYILIFNFKKHQSPHPKEARSKLPPHPSEIPLGSNLRPTGIPLGAKANFTSEPSEPPEPSNTSARVRDVEGGVGGTPPPQAAAHDQEKAEQSGSRSQQTDTAPRAKLSTTKRRSILPEGWAPNDSHHAIAAEQGVDLQSEATKFRDHAEATGRLMADWDAAFRTWLRNARRFGGSVTGHAPPKTTRTDRIIDAGHEALRLLDEAEERRKARGA